MCLILSISYLFCSCRPHEIPFYAGLLAPFAIIYIFNWVVFAIVIVFLIRQQRKAKEMKGDTATTTTKAQLKQQFISAITLSLLFGLGWGFGLPATGGIDNVAVRTTFQALFIVLTAFQGLFIFILNCLMGRKSEDARKEWKKWIYFVTCRLTKDYSQSTLSRSTIPKYGKAYKKVSTRTTSGDTSTLMRVLDSETLTRDAHPFSPTSEASSFTFSVPDSDSAFSSTVLEPESGELQSTKERVKEKAKASTDFSSELFSGYQSTLHELKSKGLQTVLEEEEGEESTICVNPTATLEETTTLESHTPTKSGQMAAGVSAENTESHQEMLQELNIWVAPVGPSQHLSNQTFTNPLAVQEEGEVIWQKEQSELDVWLSPTSTDESPAFDFPPTTTEEGSLSKRSEAGDASIIANPLATMEEGNFTERASSGEEGKTNHTSSAPAEFSGSTFETHLLVRWNPLTDTFEAVNY